MSSRHNRSWPYNGSRNGGNRTGLAQGITMPFLAACACLPTVSLNSLCFER
ncbi:hypothetical protein [Dictyobacter formicarum]|uniref:Uncharacterized protein n=1 Tax=Dictyobacter formicarum TaxID=2778368 RepID=A0ABQ3VHV3_9CHLR|nr:hypothetical protein [Dictyobacter formicarum]GHO85752.1 hypothetical protein KSZ_37580 [Dictyobacter formicarum]